MVNTIFGTIHTLFPHDETLHARMREVVALPPNELTYPLLYTLMLSIFSELKPEGVDSAYLTRLRDRIQAMFYTHSDKASFETPREFLENEFILQKLYYRHKHPIMSLSKVHPPRTERVSMYVNENLGHHHIVVFGSSHPGRPQGDCVITIPSKNVGLKNVTITPGTARKLTKEANDAVQKLGTREEACKNYPQIAKTFKYFCNANNLPEDDESWPLMFDTDVQSDTFMSFTQANSTNKTGCLMKRRAELSDKPFHPDDELSPTSTPIKDFFAECESDAASNKSTHEIMKARCHFKATLICNVNPAKWFKKGAYTRPYHMNIVAYQVVVTNLTSPFAKSTFSTTWGDEEEDAAVDQAMLAIELPDYPADEEEPTKKRRVDSPTSQTTNDPTTE